jgi:hypothetical protein
MDEEMVTRASNDLVNAVQELFEAEVAKGASDTAKLQRALVLMQELHADPERPEAAQVPGCRHLPHVLDLGELGPAATVASAIRKLEPTLAWGQNPRYNAENKGADFMDNYGWSALGLAGSTDMAFGVLLLGPDITYPPSSYESEGIFLVISGSPEWQSGDGPWVRVKAGDIICRPFGGSEGKKPGDEPLLALYAWMYKKP